MVGEAVSLGGRTAPLLVAVPVLAASTVLPWQASWEWAVSVIIVLGIPTVR